MFCCRRCCRRRHLHRQLHPSPMTAPFADYITISIFCPFKLENTRVSVAAMLSNLWVGGFFPAASYAAVTDFRMHTHTYKHRGADTRRYFGGGHVTRVGAIHIARVSGRSVRSLGASASFFLSISR